MTKRRMNKILKKSFKDRFETFKVCMAFSVTGILFFCFFGLLASAQDKNFGLGIILGEPTGLSFKNWLSGETAIDVAAAWSFERRGSLHFHGDYLIHNFDLLKVKKGKLPVYYGVGGRIRAEEKSRLGVRIPVGVSYIFENVPLDIFIEIASIMDLAPKTEFWATAFVGIRYYF